MNLAQDPSEEELRKLLAACHDDEAHHMLWVDNSGNVYLNAIPHNMTPSGFAEHQRDIMKFRFETFQSGNEYVGEEASQDKTHVSDMLHYLKGCWEKNRRGYIDDFALED